ncbi:MAG: SPOR domain-containing protein [Desulfobacterales bacterium]
MRKKNKRKAPEFKKPFIVITRRKIAGWLFLIFFLCAWMFVLGVLVGRGTAPLKFDIAALEKKIVAPKRDDLVKQKKKPAQKEAAAIKDKTELDFYEALEENKVDTKVPALQKPKTVERKIEKPVEKAGSQKSQKTTSPKRAAAKTDSPKAKPQKSKPTDASQKKKPTSEKGAAVQKTHAAGPIYTIQAASVKNPKDADKLVQKLKKRGYPAYRAIGKIPEKGIWFRVRIGKFKSKSEAIRMLNTLKKDGYKPILVMM